MRSTSTSQTATTDFFFFNDPATPEIYTLSLHDALPIWMVAVDDDEREVALELLVHGAHGRSEIPVVVPLDERSEEHTSELQSLTNLVCRLLLEKKKQPRGTETPS